MDGDKDGVLEDDVELSEEERLEVDALEDEAFINDGVEEDKSEDGVLDKDGELDEGVVRASLDLRNRGGRKDQILLIGIAVVVSGKFDVP